VVGDVGEPAQQPPFGVRAVGFAVEQPQFLGGDPGTADLLVVVAGLKPGEHPCQGSIGVVFDAAAQQPPDPIQRVVTIAAVAQRLLLHPAADLVEGVQAEPHHMERVEHGDRVGQLVADGLAASRLATSGAAKIVGPVAATR